MTEEIEQLIHDVLHGQAGAADHRRLSEWIAQSDENARAYYRVVMDERAFRVSLEREAIEALSALSDAPDDSGAGMVLAELARAEQQAHPPLVELVDPRKPWLSRHAQPIALAAGVMLAVTVGLAVMLVVPGRGPAGRAELPPFQQQAPPVPGSTTGQEVQGVATLSGQREAVWQGVAGETMPRVGEPLGIGRRLVLAEGVAEITTRQGAIAIVQAPCTIEILGSNALALDRGRLLGICETESSKGLLVRTPHMEITDIGTRFGVDASAEDATEVHVLTGSVEAVQPTRRTRQPERVLLKAGQAIRASGSRAGLIAVESDPGRFAAIHFGNTFALRGTGQGLAVGDKDPHWQVVAIGGEPLDEPVMMEVTDRLVNSDKLVKAVSGAKYLMLRNKVVPDTERYTQNKRIRYTVSTTLQLPADFDPSKAGLQVMFEADEQLHMVRINGHGTDAPSNATDMQNPTLYRMTIPGDQLKPGPNAVELEVSDLIRNNSYVWGFGIAWQLDTTEEDRP